jgi:hypothetical protein
MLRKKKKKITYGLARGHMMRFLYELTANPNKGETLQI